MIDHPSAMEGSEDSGARGVERCATVRARCTPSVTRWRSRFQWKAMPVISPQAKARLANSRDSRAASGTQPHLDSHILFAYY